ncbi:MAG: hypothetical protein ACFFDT_36390 [Candidatus Hodarchaeota archaeon]
MVERNLLQSLNDAQKIEILRKNWFSHDARWQYATFLELGFEKGNKLNYKVSNQIGKVIMHRLMNALNMSSIQTIEEFQAILEAAMDLYYPSPQFIYYFKRESNTSLLGVMKFCSIYENVQKVGISDQYKCACIAMHSGWFEALGIKVMEELKKSLKEGDEFCEFYLRIKKFGDSL